ncbi:hypothetical protein RhiirA5_381598 [Rhizophagus irregularis]|uniref:Uncharacterized protein n=1 Tax=Rhizophagus irregularis TaxID=588596 RepID=A0A2N0P440_9GLOM|nr:hypothetical protein RhiirA5_381598 [Rhizophagus irregularis]
MFIQVQYLTSYKKKKSKKLSYKKKYSDVLQKKRSTGSGPFLDAIWTTFFKRHFGLTFFKRHFRLTFFKRHFGLISALILGVLDCFQALDRVISSGCIIKFRF